MTKFKNKNSKNTPTNKSIKQANIWVLIVKIVFLIILAISTLSFLIVYIKKNFELPDEALILPRSLEDAKILSNIFTKYANKNRYKLIFVYSYIYIWKSSFGLPGSIVMNLIGGALFGEVAVGMVIILSSIGATFCYFLSKLCIGSLLNYYAKDKIKALETKIKSNENNLFFYLLFIRLFPITPNWFINIASPLLKIRFFPHFFLSNLIGLLSYNIITTQAGFILMSLKSTKEILNVSFFIKTIPLAILALIPPLFGNKIKSYFKKDKNN